MLDCQHKCVGKCGDCRDGKLHVACDEKCDRELICSHVNLLNINRLFIIFFFVYDTFRFVKHHVQVIVHHVPVFVKHVVFILNAKKLVEIYVHHAKRFA